MTGSSAMSSPSSLEEASFPAQSKRPTPKHKLQGHERDIWSFVFLHDNIHIVSGSWDGTMRKWDCDTGLLVGEPWVGVGGDIYAMALSPDGNMIACGREDGSVQRWDTDGKIMEGVWKGHSGRVESLSWSPSGGRIASGADDETILIRNAESGEVEVGPIETKQGWVYSLAYSPSGDKIASGGYNTICIWDSNTGELLVGPIKDFDFRVTSVIWSSDSSKLYTASGKFARVFDTAAGTLIHHFEHDKYVFSIAFTPKHNVLACAGIGGLAQLWDTESYQPLGKLFGEEDCEDLFCVTFSRDGRYLAYGGSDEKITLWMVEDIAPELPVSLFTPILQGDKLHNRILEPSPYPRLSSTSLLPTNLCSRVRVEPLRRGTMIHTTTFSSLPQHLALYHHQVSLVPDLTSHLLGSRKSSDPFDIAHPRMRSLRCPLLAGSGDMWHGSGPGHTRESHPRRAVLLLQLHHPQVSRRCLGSGNVSTTFDAARLHTTSLRFLLHVDFRDMSHGSGYTSRSHPQ
ncbi:WD40 repeat-like protein [Rhizopogon vinicolor AM-OR11-026]|uniref:WD40 repeat-like protein n=1 Tax=Rhizopogon vinicolor AM-OR11-026 TaxID=1314800 RepID=A0A1B7MPA4_9AGAM|nr:WD40 repeat-like protein [Rhizopogon vinicolor AM-OR11-026]